MSVETFGFVIRGGTHAKVPTSPAVNICLKRWTKYGIFEEPLISSDLTTDSEIDEHIEALKTNLEAVRAAAKHALRKAEGGS